MPLNQSEKNFFNLLAQREAANPSKPLEQQSLEEFRVNEKTRICRI